ncbi:MAG TPA: hypothetical protein VGF60_06095 [Xanthobacteraceae bacterium]|jgi:hypothetical protein
MRKSVSLIAAVVALTLTADAALAKHARLKRTYAAAPAARVAPPSAYGTYWWSTRPTLWVPYSQVYY